MVKHCGRSPSPVDLVGRSVGRRVRDAPSFAGDTHKAPSGRADVEVNGGCSRGHNENNGKKPPPGNEHCFEQTMDEDGKKRERENLPAVQVNSSLAC